MAIDPNDFEEPATLDKEDEIYGKAAGQTTGRSKRWTGKKRRASDRIYQYPRGLKNIANGASAVSVLYATDGDGDLEAAAVGFMFAILNTSADATKRRIEPTIVTANSTTGFTVQLSGTTNTANYQLSWMVVGEIA